MLPKPINSSVKAHFDEVYSRATKDAIHDFNNNFLPQFRCCNIFHKVKLIIDEDARIRKVIAQSQYPYYVQNHSSESWLLNQFASRTYLLNTDESVPLYESVHTGKYWSLLMEQKIQLSEIIPPYTFNDFMSGVIDPFFTTYDYAINISEDNYNKIRQWQVANFVRIISFESRIFIRIIQQHCKDLPDPLAFIKAEKEKIRQLLELKEPDGFTLKQALSELFFLRDLDTRLFDDIILAGCFSNANSDRMIFNYVTPTFVDPLIAAVDKESFKNFSNEVSIFFSIIEASYWFDDVIAGLPVQHPVEPVNWDLALQIIRKEVAPHIKALVENLESHINTHCKSDEDVRKCLADELDHYRRKFNNHSEKSIFAWLNEDKFDMLKSYFTAVSFFNHDLQGMSQRLADAIIIHDLCWEIVGIYGAYFDTRKRPSHADTTGWHSIAVVMNQMVLDKKLYDESQQCFNDFFHFMEHYTLPFEIAIDNIREVMTTLFARSLEYLQEVLDNADPTKKILYLLSRLKQLRQRQLERRQFMDLEPLNKFNDHFAELFREFLEIESSFIKEMNEFQASSNINISDSSVRQLPFANPLPESLPKPSRPRAVIPGAYKLKNYAAHLTELTDMMNFLEKNEFIAKTDIKDFRGLFNGEGPSKPVQWLAGIESLAYFIRLLHVHHKLIDNIPINIWKVTSRLFIDYNSCPFDSHKFKGQHKPSDPSLLVKAVDFIR